MSYNPENPNGQATSANSAPVVVASDQSAINVNSTLSAETTKVIGVTRTADGSGNLITSTGNAIDVNVKTNAATNQSVNNAQVAGNTIDTNSGNKSSGTQRVVIATDQPNFTSALNVSAAQSGTWTVQPGNTANSTAWLVSAVPATSGGLTTYHLISAGSTNATVVKNSAGQLFGWMISNTTSAYSYLAFHNTTSTPTAGASIFFKIGIPPYGGANVEFTNGIAFSTGIAITTVTGTADNSSTAVAANDLVINLFYK